MQAIFNGKNVEFSKIVFYHSIPETLKNVSGPGAKIFRNFETNFNEYFQNKISFLDFSVGLNLSNLSNSPTLKSVLSSPSVSKFKEISQSHLNSVKASPSFRKKGSNLSRGLSVKFKKVQLICTPLL